MVTVSLCMIVKNEEKVLARCLESVRGFADEIIIIDTGSEDRTREIAAGFTRKIYSFPWQEDFAAARNFSFSMGKGDYLFWLDADDVIPESQRPALMRVKARLERERPDVVMFPYAVAFDDSGIPTLTFYRERILKNCALAKWNGRVHEAVAPFGKIIKEQVRVEHRKIHVSDPERNLKIFQKMLEEGEKFTDRDMYYYGMELYYNRRYRESADAFWRVIRAQSIRRNGPDSILPLL